MNHHTQTKIYTYAMYREVRNAIDENHIVKINQVEYKETAYFHTGENTSLVFNVTGELTIPVYDTELKNVILTVYVSYNLNNKVIDFDWDWSTEPYYIQCNDVVDGINNYLEEINK